MSYYSSYRPESRWSNLKDALPLVLLVLVGILTVAWMIAEFACTRTFVGTLSFKGTEVSYSHERRRLGEDGWEGEDKTTARIDYKLTFYSEGKLRPVSVDYFSESVKRVNADSEALQKLMASHVEPGLYTHTRPNVTYIVTVSGWLLDGRLIDAVNIDTVPAEK